jgi:hypothetical protein
LGRAVLRNLVTDMLRFQKQYFILAMLLFLIEVLIAAYLHDKMVRPYVGDFLVVILLYCLVKSFFTVSTLQAAVSVLIFSYIIELSQYFHLVSHLGLQNSKLVATILGSSFEWIDLIAYTAGIAVVLYIEKIRETYCD